ncbi:MAG: hypothetical protein OEZ21_06930 [Candidatus Bathyarchaeota archaeon]|nr:hypothetical protein [Candidatus Bathyarchaeota archaeon]
MRSFAPDQLRAVRGRELPKTGTITGAKHRERRSEAEKVGRRKYIIKLLHRLEAKIDRVDKRTRVIMASLSEYMDPGKDYLSMVVCRDEVDQAILWELSTATSEGWSTTEISERLLPEFKLNRFQILRRIKRMNKRLEAEMGRMVAESREHRWVMTRYVHRILGATKEEIEEMK